MTLGEVDKFFVLWELVGEYEFSGLFVRASGAELRATHVDAYELQQLLRLGFVEAIHERYGLHPLELALSSR